MQFWSNMSHPAPSGSPGLQRYHSLRPATGLQKKAAPFCKDSAVILSHQAQNRIGVLACLLLLLLPLGCQGSAVGMSGPLTTVHG